MRRYPEKLQGNDAHFHMQIYYMHVNGHVDKYLLWHQLSLIRQLNCVCDTLAKEAMTSATMQGYHNRPTQLLPKENVAVVIRATSESLSMNLNYICVCESIR